MRRREAKVSDTGGNMMVFDLCQIQYTAIAEINSFRSGQSLGASLYSYIIATRLESWLEEEIGGSGRR